MAHPHGALLNGPSDFWRGFLQHFAGTLYAALAHVQHFGGGGLRNLANWRLIRRATLRHVRQLRRHHCALAFRQVPAVQVQADDEARSVCAFVQAHKAIDAHGLGHAPTIASVKDLALKHPDRLTYAVLQNVGHQVRVCQPVNQRKDVR